MFAQPYCSLCLIMSRKKTNADHPDRSRHARALNNVELLAGLRRPRRLRFDDGLFLHEVVVLIAAPVGGPELEVGCVVSAPCQGCARRYLAEACRCRAARTRELGDVLLVGSSGPERVGGLDVVRLPQECQSKQHEPNAACVCKRPSHSPHRDCQTERRALLPQVRHIELGAVLDQLVERLHLVLKCSQVQRRVVRLVGRIEVRARKIQRGEDGREDCAPACP